MPARICKDRIEIQTGRSSRHASYAIAEAGGHYHTRLDRCESVGGELKLTGWAMDLLRASPAEAVIVFGGSEQALIFPIFERRPDIAKNLNISEVAGFHLQAPWVRPRVFVLFESGVAIEMHVPPVGGTA